MKTYSSKPYKNGGKIHFRVYLGKSEKGSPKYEFFGSDEKAAITYAKRLNNQEKARRLNNLEKISPEEANDLRWAIESLALHGASLKEAVEWFIKTRNPEKGNQTIKEVGVKFLNYQQIRLKGSTLTQLKLRVGRLERFFPNKFVNEITEEDLIHFTNVQGKYWSKITEFSEKQFLIYFFKWMQKNGFIHRYGITPAQNIPIPRKEYKKNKLAKPEEVSEFLQYLCLKAANQNNEKKRKSLYGTIARNALILFCCIRREEALKISWDNINLEKRTIEIEAAASKTSQRRHIKMTENAFNWIMFCKLNKAELETIKDLNQMPEKNSKKLSYWFRKYRSEFADEKKIPEFCKTVEVKTAKGQVLNRIQNQNIFRHSAITYHLEKFKSVYETALLAGNSERVIRSSYKEINKDPFAPDAFFAINPPTIYREEVGEEINIEEAVSLFKKLHLMKRISESNQTKKIMRTKLRKFMSNKENKNKLIKSIDSDTSDPFVRKYGQINPSPNNDAVY